MEEQHPDPEGSSRLTHLEPAPGGPQARMVDVSAKEVSQRSATAEAWVLFPEGVLGTVLAGQGPKGAVVEVARIAAIGAAKKTADLIPMCHPLGLDGVDVQIEPEGDRRLRIRATARTAGRTGVEMEAMTAAAVGALTLYDMTKGLSKGVQIESVRLLEKRGGASGHWTAGDPGPQA